MIKRREEDGFNLAFLDVMACGLGAVILIFMLVKFQAHTNEPVEEAERLKAELEQLQTQQQDFKEQLSDVNADKRSQQQLEQQLVGAIDILEKENQDVNRAKSEKVAVVADLEKSVAAAAKHQAQDVVKMSGSGEEQYLLGLKVDGKNIGILLDHSASMTDVKLTDIIKRKIASSKQKKDASKWRRTRRVAKWLLNRVPKDSRVSMVSFNDKAKLVGAKKVVKGNDKKGLKNIAKRVDMLTPTKGTNLQSALAKIKKVNPYIDSLYVITDGLPTLGDNDSGLSSFRKCKSFFGKSNTITGECRYYLFVHSIKNVNLAGVKVNVILLPLEGDPGAADAFWQWSAATGGLFISPARSWP